MTVSAWTLEPSKAVFPPGLRELDPVPELLHGTGLLEVLAGLEPERAVTIVGARRASAYGREMAFSLGAGLAAAGLVVVSGMAFGCDAAAHEGALSVGGQTVAVLGCGPDVAYPRSLRGLHSRIADAGAIVSEYPPGTPAAAWHFPARNRLMAALASHTVVVEARERSGTRITADMAASLVGRGVGAVPGRATSALAELPNSLIRDGAHLVRDAQDVLDLALGVGVVSVRRGGPDLDGNLGAVLAALEMGAATADAVAVGAGIDAREAAVALARLELMGYIHSDASGMLERTNLQTPDS